MPPLIKFQRGKAKMVAKEQSTWRYFIVSSRFRKVLLLLFMVTLLVAFLYVPRPVQYHINYIRRIVHGEIRTDYTQPHIEIQSHDAETTTTKKNFMFIKTHKCGTSSLVNVFYLLGVRRRLNFVVQKGEHQLYFGANYIKTNGRYTLIQCNIFFYSIHLSAPSFV